MISKKSPFFDSPRLLDRLVEKLVVGVAQLVERRIVVPVAEGSNPSTHPMILVDFFQIPFFKG